jgi:outer membrane protein OmpA-like peptidoglycan-associated protein
MNKYSPLIAIAGAIAFASSSCQSTNPYTGQQEMSKKGRGAIVGATGGAILGAVIANNTGENGDAGRGALIGAAAGGLAGAGIGGYMDKQEAVIRERLRSSGVGVTRVGNNIILNMPHDITFDVARDEIRPEFAQTLDSVAVVLNEFNKTLVNVNGHTDSDGATSYNEQLSESRARAVSGFLSSRGVNQQRLIPRGYGEAQPVAPNQTAGDKARNRRVEIHIVPRN